jgi:DNA-binding beta-propeller fold protein YncE
LIDNETGDKLYVKDDKQIMVFDLSNNCSFVRKFGLKILQKPYGLTLNKEGHLIVVDTYARSPVIHIFNKATGELMKSSPYQPAIFEHAKSSVLNSLYYDNKADLIPFDRSKIRFIDCFQNYIYASDLGRSIVFKTTLDGKTELAFGTFGNTPGQMNEPSGIHVDYDGKSVLVGDSKNNRLQVEFYLII